VRDSSVVNFGSPTANMYGCEPCPECGSKYRCVFAATNTQIDCDDCGYTEQIRPISLPEGESIDKVAFCGWCGGTPCACKGASEGEK
jgi:hypothetical protein